MRSQLGVWRHQHAVSWRWPTVAVWALGSVAALACYLRLAGTQAVNSDGAAQALQAWDMLHGNLLLHGWTVSDVSFYTTELPEYVLVDFFRGLIPDVVHVAAAITYTLVVLLAALLAKSTASGRAALVRVLVTVGIMVAPQLPQGINILISSPDHIGTSAPILVAWLILDRARPRRWVPVAIAVALGWAAVADQLVLIVGVLPLVFVCLVRVINAVGVERQELRAQRYDLALGAGALAGGGAAWLALRLISATGGFGLQPVAAHLDSSVADLPSHLAIAGQGLLLLGGADFIGQPPGVGAGALALHLVGVGLAALAVLAAAIQFLHGRDRVNQVLVTGVAFNLAAYAFSTRAIQIRDVREMAPVLPLSAVLAGRLLADRIRVSKFALPALSVIFLGYLSRPGVRADNPAGAGPERADRILAGGSPLPERPVGILAGKRDRPDHWRAGARRACGGPGRWICADLLGYEARLVRPAPKLGRFRPDRPDLSQCEECSDDLRPAGARVSRRALRGTQLFQEPAHRPRLTSRGARPLAEDLLAWTYLSPPRARCLG